ncbi:PIG-L deacetylase family protein [Aureimonas leprariae]|uniref:PIG-L family deacetylase n=1 Tax=Plantimonas leprariae TaxID=2615207 RepID=A0A7V7PT89_9HYPH|nr:PIG-L deacetylase family protein [Aureimonas leprariae]KAB0682929.1 PIG-L family deacetylase [Aureimonas leprariae]
MRLDPASIEASRILVVAPHQDDESLGCGGLIATLAPLGRRFHTVFVTDGGASHRNSASWPRERLAAAREAEAAEALRRLGIGDHPRSFFRLPDAAMPAAGTAEHGKALRAFVDIVRGFRPDLVLLPWRRDPHCDHRDAFALASGALAATDMPAATLEYAIWLDELGSPEDRPQPDEAERVDFDVAAVLPAKRAAVAAHLSQTGDLIHDDPDGFHLTPATIERLAGPVEAYWRPHR